MLLRGGLDEPHCPALRVGIGAHCGTDLGQIRDYHTYMEFSSIIAFLQMSANPCVLKP